jgi:sugar O-acyltransferase (sialic acid O-acetyltransferase NeuD family)
VAELTRVFLPRENVNDESYLVAGVGVENGSLVRKGEVLFTCEGSKSTFEVESPAAGHAYHALAAGATLPVGALLAVVSPTALSEPEQRAALAPEAETPAASGQVTRPESGPAEGPLPRFTRKAAQLAEAHGLDARAFLGRQSVTQADVEAYLASRQVSAAPAPKGSGGAGLEVLIYGGGGHATMCIDLLRRLACFRVVGIIDDRLEIGSQVMGVPVVGTSEDLRRLHDGGVRFAVNGVGGVPDTRTRRATFDRLKAVGFVLPNLIHPTAIVEPSAVLGEGNHVMAGALVGSQARLGDDCVVNSGAIVSHDCDLRDHAHVAPGAVLGGGVLVGEGALVGMGVSVYMRVRIGEWSVVTNGVSLFADVPPHTAVKRQQDLTMIPRQPRSDDSH